MDTMIGISCSYDQDLGRFFLPVAYVEAVIRAGGCPVILPGSGSLTDVLPYLRMVKGLILSGGGDVDPSYFNEEPLPGLGEITPSRDRFEIMLATSALQRKIPILGICRGIQVLNIACGGRVIQHLPVEIKRPLKHAQAAPRWYPTHRVVMGKNTLLAAVLREQTVMVNSFHHQAVREPAPGFRVSAVSSDGVIEAIEHPAYPFVLGVQWHPEGMKENDPSCRLFAALVKAARESAGVVKPAAAKKKVKPKVKP